MFSGLQKENFSLKGGENEYQDAHCPFFISTLDYGLQLKAKWTEGGITLLYFRAETEYELVPLQQPVPWSSCPGRHLLSTQTQIPN